jgi:uncharacterized membrane protein
MPNIAGNLPLLDVFAFSWFVSCWVGYTYYSSCGSLKRKSLLAAMDQYREEWALSILSRDNRIVDSQVINGLIRKETFFASTTVLILVGVITQIGSYEKYALISSELSFAEPPSAMLWLLKICLLAFVFVHAFFKFTWSIRQHSYSAILLTSIPMPNDRDIALSKDTAFTMARLSSLGAKHFNDGVRAYYFALAELSWFLHPVAFILSTTWIVLVLYRREYQSKALKLLTRG